MAIFKNKSATSSVDPVTIAQQHQQQEEHEVETAYQKGITALRDFIAPSSLEYSSTYFLLGTRYRPHLLTYMGTREIYTPVGCLGWSTWMKLWILVCISTR